MTHTTTRKARAPRREEYVTRLAIAIGKARESLTKVQQRYKKNFDRKVRHIRKLKPDNKVYLDISDVGEKRSKLSHAVGGAYRIKSLDKSTNTVVIQRGDVVERVSMNRVIRAPSSAPVEEPRDTFEATTKDLEEKVTDGKKWVMKRILGHREKDDGTLEFRVDWAGNWNPTWEPRRFLPEEAVSRYFARYRRSIRPVPRGDATV